MSSFSRMATVEASTKRVPAITGGKRGEATTFIASLFCTPLDPVDAEIMRRLNLGTAHELLQTFVDATHDIREGDHLVVKSSGKAYPVRATEDWAWRKGTYRRLVIEDLKA